MAKRPLDQRSGPELFKKILLKQIKERGLEDVLNEISSQYYAWDEFRERCKDFNRRAEIKEMEVV